MAKGQENRPLDRERPGFLAKGVSGMGNPAKREWRGCLKWGEKHYICILEFDMDSVRLHDKEFVPYISNEELEKDIDAVAQKVNEQHKNDTEAPILLCVLNGAILFTAELMKRLEFNCELMSIKLSSYEGTRSVGTVKTDMGLTGSVKGRTVIVCEDIVDTGNTIVSLHKMLLEAGAAKVEICTMLLKPEVYKQPLKPDYVGREIPARFIVGFGLDYDQLGRNLKDIYVLKD